MAAEFFDKLPVRLTAAEKKLRDHLVEAAIVAKQLLPQGDAVSLQEWVECRMPGEIELRTDGAGMVILMPSGKAAKGKASGKGGEKAALQAFLSRLPGDSFFPEEEALREEIVTALAKSPLSIPQVMRESRIMSAAKAFLPAGVHLEDWIERRIGAEVTIEDDRGQRVCRLVGGETLKEQKEPADAFFARLPKNSFLPEEERLRLAIFDFLAGWSSQELATLSHAASDRNVQEARRFLLGNTAVGFKDWIERRVGGELLFKEDRKGQHEIHLTPSARPFVAERVALLQAKGPPPGYPMGPPPGFLTGPPPMGHPMGPPPMAPMGPPMPVPRDPPKAGRQPGSIRDRNGEQMRFFDTLPADELLDLELDLRQLLVDHLEQHCAEHPSSEGPQLSNVGADKACQKLKQDLLKGQVSLREWIDRRIGGEIATKKASNGQCIIYYRDGRHANRAKEPAAEDSMEASRAPDSKAESWFDGLPQDGFHPEEESLREALLNFLEGWTGPDPPNLTDANLEPEIRDARAKCIPKASGVSLKMWIDRRIGGEIATWRKDGTAKEVSCGLREQWGEIANAANLEEAAAAPNRKRKADDQGGKGGVHRKLGGKGGAPPRGR